MLEENATHAVEDGRQPAPLRQGRDEQAVHVVVDDRSCNFVVERVDVLVVAVLLVGFDRGLLSAMARVCEERASVSASERNSSPTMRCRHAEQSK